MLLTSDLIADIFQLVFTVNYSFKRNYLFLWTYYCFGKKCHLMFKKVFQCVWYLFKQEQKWLCDTV